MKIHLSLPLLFGLSAPAWAGSDVTDGSSWYGGGHSVTVNVAGDSGPQDTSVTVTVTDDSGTSPAANGSEGDNSTPTDPTCDDSDVITTPDGDQFRVEQKPGCDAKLQRKGSNGKWIDMLKSQKKDASQNDSNMYLRVGDPAPFDGTLWPSDGSAEIPMRALELAPFDGYFGGPGEEVPSLPE